MNSVSSTPLFKGLTRPVSLLGLPMTYVVLLMFVVIGGFIATLSIAWLIGSGIVGYAGLRALATWDARILDVTFVVLRATPITRSLIKSRGVTYDA